MKGYSQRYEGNKLIVESFGEVKSLNLSQACRREKYGNITQVVINCDIPVGAKILLNDTNVELVVFQKGRNDCIVNRNTPNTKIIDTTITASTTTNLPQPAQPSSYELPKPIARPANDKKRSYEEVPPTYKASRSDINNYAKPPKMHSSDDEDIAPIVDYRDGTSTSSSSSTQYTRVLSEQDEVVLAAMGYSKEDFEELVNKEYKLDKVKVDLRPVILKLLEQRANNYQNARLHQVVGLSEYLDALTKGKKNALFEYATGSGKTFMFTQLATAFRGAYASKDVTILVPTRILRDQTAEAFKQFAPTLQVNIVEGGRELIRELSSTQAKVNIVTYQLALTGANKDKAQELLANSSTVIMDEAHYALPYFNKNSELNESLKNIPTLAFTATPEFNLTSVSRGKLNDVNNLVGYDRKKGDNPITKFNAVPAILSKANCPVKCMVVFPTASVTADLAAQNIADNAVSTQVSNAINTEANNLMVADIILNGQENGEPFRYQKAIGFCAGTQHADELVATINGIPNIVEIVDPNGLMRMEYALNLFAKKMSSQDIAQIKTLVAGILSCAKNKSSAEQMTQDIANFFDASNCVKRNKDIVLNSWNESVDEAYAKFKVASAVHSKKDKKDEPNEEELEQFKLGGTRFMFGDQMLIAGFDDPATSIILNVNPTASEPAAIQRAGRGLRLDPNNQGKVCKVVDFDWGIKTQRLFYEYLGNDEQGNPNLQLGDMPEAKAAAPLDRVDLLGKNSCEVVSEYKGGKIEIAHKQLRKQQRQQEQVDKVRGATLGVVLEASLTKFNETLNTLEILKAKLKQKLDRDEEVVKEDKNSATVDTKKRSRSSSEDNSSSEDVPKKPRVVKQPKQIVMQGRYTRELSKQIRSNVQKAREMIETINEFFEVLDLNSESLASTSSTKSKSFGSGAAGGTSIYAPSMDSELLNFTKVASSLTGLVNKLQGMMKLNTLSVASVSNASNSLHGAAAGNPEDEARDALVSLIDNMNSIQNSSVLEDNSVDRLIQHAKQKKRELEEQKQRQSAEAARRAEAEQKAKEDSERLRQQAMQRQDILRQKAILEQKALHEQRMQQQALAQQERLAQQQKSSAQQTQHPLRAAEERERNLINVINGELNVSFRNANHALARCEIKNIIEIINNNLGNIQLIEDLLFTEYVPNLGGQSYHLLDRYITAIYNGVNENIRKDIRSNILEIIKTVSRASGIQSDELKKKVIESIEKKCDCYKGKPHHHYIEKFLTEFNELKKEIFPEQPKPAEQSTAQLDMQLDEKISEDTLPSNQSVVMTASSHWDWATISLLNQAKGDIAIDDLFTYASTTAHINNSNTSTSAQVSIQPDIFQQYAGYNSPPMPDNGRGI
jgi:superfamily II DNA or RNA helicase